MITTTGFQQILHLARSQTPGPLAGWIIMIKPDPPASLADTREAVERMDPRGETITPVDEEQVETIVRSLVESGVETLTVALINSYVNGAHERQIGELVERLYPGFPVTLSSEVLPEFREYERALTACMNSYVRPRVADYVNRLQQQLTKIGARAEVNILRSDAGLMTTREASRNPIYGVLSGPSGGVAGALFVARKAGYDDILTFDMGGTSTDVALCQNGQPTIGRETSIGQFRIKVPSVNVHTVGAGGGSLVWTDAGGALRVGPQSAGANPGPACYGRGGTQGTVTDANLLLGRLPGQLAGGVELDRGAADRALAGVDPAAVVDVVNAEMLGALRVVSVERGHDPADFALVAFGGAGPLHACELAEELGIGTVLVPEAAGVLSALGLVASEERRDAVRSYLVPLADAGELPREGEADLRYAGQSFELTLPLQEGLAETFHRVHEEQYGFAEKDREIELVAIRTAEVRKGPELDLPRGEDTATVTGPAVVELPGSTCWIPPGWVGARDGRTLRLAKQ